MGNIKVPLQNGSCIIEPDRIITTILFGWKVVIDQFKQEITQQLSIFRMPIPLLKFTYKFSDVYRVGKVRTDKRSPLMHDSTGDGTDLSSGASSFKFTYDVILFLKTGSSIKVASMSHWYKLPVVGLPPALAAGIAIGQAIRVAGNKPVDGIVIIEAAIRDMIGLPQEY